jgi:phosphoserine phosphatase
MAAPIVVTDLEGTLTTAQTWRGVHEWIHAHHPSAAARRFVALRLPLVALSKVGLYEAETLRARWVRDQARLLEGVSAGDLAEMGAWVVDRSLWPARRQAAIDAVTAAIGAARDRDPATQLILATGGYQPIGDAFAARIGATAALGTPLEIRAGIATGRLAAPTQSGRRKAAAVRARAAGGTVVAAFGDTAGDIPMLELADRAVAVAPDAKLRGVAGQRGWEILEG